VANCRLEYFEMMRSIAFLPVSLWLAMSATAGAQAMIEGALGASRAATTAAPAKGVGKSLSGLAGSLDKVLKAGAAEQQSSSSATLTPASQPVLTAANAPQPESKWEDPSGIETGVTYEDLLRRFGPYSMVISDSTQKTLTYRGKAGYFQVRVEEGKVASIEKPPAARDPR
jgi:hypothetical protein